MDLWDFLFTCFMCWSGEESRCLGGLPEPASAAGKGDERHRDKARVIGEIGAGRGRYAVRLAVRVGKTGKIYANDILESKLDYLKFRCKRDNIPNLITILGELTDPRFPEGELDMGSHSTPKDVLIKEVGAAGFELVRIETILSQDNIYIFKLKK